MVRPWDICGTTPGDHGVSAIILSGGELLPAVDRIVCKAAPLPSPPTNGVLRPRGAFCEAVADAERDDLRALLPHRSPLILRTESAIGKRRHPAGRARSVINAGRAATRRDPPI